MKKFFLLILASLTLGTFGLALGESISLDPIEGTLQNQGDGSFVSGNVMATDTTYVFPIRFSSPNSNHKGLTVGWRVYSDDGATWTTTVIDTTGTLGKTEFDLAWLTQDYSITGSGADTVGLAGSVMFNTIGMPQGFDDIVATVTIGPIMAGSEGTMICLDSCYNPPTGTWKWAGPDVFPDWDGPHCWSVFDPANAVSLNGGDQLPTTWSLNQNYPNPFNPTTEIAFDVPRQTNVRIRIFNVLGQRVIDLVDEVLGAGRYTTSWDGTSSSGSSVSSGVYFYRLETDSYVDTKKMMLLK